MKPLQPTLLCLFRYDALDRLIGHTPSDELQLQRFYCKSRLTTEVQGVIKHSIVQQGDLLLAQQRGEGDAFETSLLTTDQQRSVMRTLKADHPPLPLAYSPYGHRPPANGMCSLLGFNGERPDPATGHYLLGNGYRAFNPVLMRFNSPDSMSPFGKGGLNSYAYCIGDPINRSDNTGHTSIAKLFPMVASRLQALAKRAISNVAYKKRSLALQKYNTLKNRDIEDFDDEYNVHLKRQQKRPTQLIRSIESAEDASSLDNNTLHKFVLSNDGQLIVGAPTKKTVQLRTMTINRTKYMTHAVLGHYSRSRNIISAGYLTTETFPRVSIINTSGHYQPEFKTLKPVYEILEGMGIQVTAIRHTNPYYNS